MDAKTTPTATDDNRLRGISENTLAEIIGFEKANIERFAPYRETLINTDRKRIMGSGLKSAGLIELADSLTANNSELLPSYLARSVFHNDVNDFLRKRELLAVIRDFEKQAEDSMLVAADKAFHDTLQVYNFVKEGARQRIPGFDAAYQLLKPYFKKSKPANKETIAQVERDVEALLKGKKDGKIVIENQSPTLTGGKHVVADEMEVKKIAIHANANLTEKE